MAEGTDLALNTACFIVGITCNSYIIAMNIKISAKVGSLSPREKLVTSLSCLNVCLQLVMAANFYYSYFWPDSYMAEDIRRAFMVTGMAFILSSLWISTWLCVYCCMKISNSQMRFFRWLRLWFPSCVPWLILVSVLLSLVISFPGLKDLYVVDYLDKSKLQESNITILNSTFQSKCSCSLWIYFAVSSIAFVIFLASTLAILRSLWRHMRKMENMATAFGDPKLDKLLRAAMTVTSLLFLCLSFYIAQVFLINGFVPFATIKFTICMLIVSMFPGLNAVILIMGNQKMKDPVLEWLTNPICLR